MGSEGRFETIGIIRARREEEEEEEMPGGGNEAAGAKRTSFNRAPEEREPRPDAAKVL